MKRIAIFGSGAGTNAGQILKHFEESDLARVQLIVSDQRDAGILKRARDYGVPALTCTMEELQNGTVLQKLIAQRIDLVVLAGFLKKIPPSIVSHYPNRIVNIHPALLPDYGGKGMYGLSVHKAVVANEEEETGITIHYVNEKYDDGEIIFQDVIEIDPDDTPEDVAGKVQEQEHRHYAPVIEWVLTELD
jgi:phosphoribosylglycinamide formyltransferase-1